MLLRNFEPALGPDPAAVQLLSHDAEPDSLSSARHEPQGYLSTQIPSAHACQRVY